MECARTLKLKLKNIYIKILAARYDFKYFMIAKLCPFMIAKYVHFNLDDHTFIFNKGKNSVVLI